MQAKVYVSLKKDILDPQGKTIHNSLHNLGFNKVIKIRQGKFFEINFAPTLSREEVEVTVKKIAKEVLTNPVIEDFSYKVD